ncbi:MULTISPECIES: hypothetical protein [Paenibacillus]|uniref:hypothetical protein n=1 Tax=Paenibacillus TaxID=44249 RepID=UPI0003E2BCBB|nr:MULTISPECIES: hypothetical protein [Paenibacillus]ETT64905.1 hypothetical protein C171_07812 [Paenibacillus sp. FSL H8-237]
MDDRWLKFENFKEDMHGAYLAHAAEYGEDSTTIERIDVNGSYCADNTCWVTKAEQALNTRSTLNAIGVFETNSGKWCAYIKRRGNKHSRTFETRDEALEWRAGIADMYAKSV